MSESTGVSADVRVAGLLFFALAAGFLTVLMLGGAMAPGYAIGLSAISDLGVIEETALFFNVSLLTVGVLVSVLGILADLIATNRKLLEANMLKLRRIEDRLSTLDQPSPQSSADIAPSVDSVRRKAS